MRVDRFTAVFAFDLDDSIVLSAGARIKAAQRRFGGDILTVNTPDQAPPELPRLVLRTKDMLVNVGLNRYEFTFPPPAHVASSYAEALTFVRNRVTPLAELLLKSGVRYRWVGLVGVLDFPGGAEQPLTGVEAVAPVFQRLVRLDWDPASLAAFKLQVGIRRDGFFCSYTFSGYEMKEMEVLVPEGKRRVRVDLAEGQTTESGVQLILDINNKARSGRAGAMKEFSELLREHDRAAASLVRDFMLEGVL